jgi:hypothetical protein
MTSTSTGEQSIFSDVASVFVMHNGAWQSVDGGVSRVNVCHNFSTQAFRVLALSSERKVKGIIFFFFFFFPNNPPSTHFHSVCREYVDFFSSSSRTSQRSLSGSARHVVWRGARAQLCARASVHQISEHVARLNVAQQSPRRRHLGATTPWRARLCASERVACRCTGDHICARCCAWTRACCGATSLECHAGAGAQDQREAATRAGARRRDRRRRLADLVQSRRHASRGGLEGCAHCRAQLGQQSELQL